MTHFYNTEVSKHMQSGAILNIWELGNIFIFFHFIFLLSMLFCNIFILAISHYYIRIYTFIIWIILYYIHLGFSYLDRYILNELVNILITDPVHCTVPLTLVIKVSFLKSFMSYPYPYTEIYLYGLKIWIEELTYCYVFNPSVYHNLQQIMANPFIMFINQPHSLII